MRAPIKIAGVFAVAAGLAYGITWALTGLGYALSSEPETTRDYSDNGLRILTSDYRAGWSNFKPQRASYAVLLDSKEHGVVACHGIKSWPQNTIVGKNLGGEYPDTLYADSPIADLVFKKSDVPSDDGTLQLGACFKYETPLSNEAIDALASEDYKGSSFAGGVAIATADVGVSHPYYGFPIMAFQDRDYVTLSTGPEEKNINQIIVDIEPSGTMTAFRWSGDLTRIASFGMINDTVRDRRYLGPLKVIFGDLNTSDRHPVEQQVCMNAGYNEVLERIANYHDKHDSTLEGEKDLLESLGTLKLTACPS